MASARGYEHPADLFAPACCKCPKSDEKMNKQCSPYFESAITKFEERRDDLTNRQQYLRQKITTMERSIPALIAFNMLKTSGNCDNSPICKVKEIMTKLSPHRDPTDKLLDKLRNTVESLNGETAELHDKIIAADIKLEESEMELESLELANVELETRLSSLEKELKRHETPSLHSIHSDDLICLSKICQLGEAEVNLKNSIKELEERENLFHRQIDRIFKSKEFREASCEGMNNKIRQLECNERKMQCALHMQKCNVQQLKKKLKRNEMEHASMNNVENSTAEKTDKETNLPKVSNTLSNVISNRDNIKDKVDPGMKSHELSQRLKNYEEDSLANCVCQTSALIACYDETSCPATSRSKVSKNLQSSCNAPSSSKCFKPSTCSLKSCCVTLTPKLNESRRQACKESSALPKAPCKAAKGKVILSAQIAPKKKRQESTPYNLAAICTKCQGFKISKQCAKQTFDCSCSCKGKCATGASGVPCNCAEYLSSADKEDIEQSGNSTKNNDQSSTDEEYCECCDCGCEDSDLSDTQC